MGLVQCFQGLCVEHSSLLVLCLISTVRWVEVSEQFYMVLVVSVSVMAVVVSRNSVLLRRYRGLDTGPFREITEYHSVQV